MPDVETARRLALGCAEADDALVALARTVDPTLWHGPAAAAWAAIVAGRGGRARAAVEEARAAGAALAVEGG